MFSYTLWLLENRNLKGGKTAPFDVFHSKLLSKLLFQVSIYGIVNTEIFRKIYITLNIYQRHVYCASSTFVHFSALSTTRFSVGKCHFRTLVRKSMFLAHLYKNCNFGNTSRRKYYFSH